MAKFESGATTERKHVGAGWVFILLASGQHTTHAQLRLAPALGERT